MSADSPLRATLNPYFLLTICLATLGPLQFGFHLLNTPEQSLRCLKPPAPDSSNPTSLPRCIPLSDALFGLASSIYTLGGLLGALAAGPLSSRHGRLFPMLLTSLFFFVGSLCSALAPGLALLVGGRFLVGIGAGASIVVVPIYISETVPEEMKGVFGALTQIMTNAGIVVTQSMGWKLGDRLGGAGWRITLGTGAIIGVVQGVGLLVATESAEWLASKGRVKEAMRAAAKLRRDGGADALADDGEEQALLPGDRDTDTSTSSPKDSSKSIGILEVATHPEYRAAVIAVVGVMLAQQLCGINSVVMYSVNFLREVLQDSAGLITIIVSSLNLVVTILCSPLPDKIGRKACLLSSIAGMGSMALLLGLGILHHIKALSAIATLLFVASFAVGLGPVPFILSAELVGPGAVGATQSWALAASWIATFLVAQFFPILSKVLDHGRVFFVFTVLAACFFAFVAWFLPETRGRKSADEVWGRQERRRD